jgi:hypothetical protein
MVRRAGHGGCGGAGRVPGQRRQRRSQLEVAARWLADGVGVGIEDLAVANEGPIQTIACRIIDWLGWTA